MKTLTDHAPSAPANRGTSRIPPGRAALAGVVSAAVALAITEVASVLGSQAGPSVVSVVASRMVDLTAGTLKDVAVNLFGTNDKAALIAGIVIVSLCAGAALGMASVRRGWAGVAGFGLFGVIGVIAANNDAQASVAALTIASLLGAVAGAFTLFGLMRLARAMRVPEPPHVQSRSAPTRVDDPRVKQASRRTFFALAGAAGTIAGVTALASKHWRGTSPAAKSRAATTLPPPKRSIPLPAGQPFALDGLTPYVTPNGDFYRIDTAIFVPQVDASSWKMSIKGMVDHPLTFTYSDLLAMDLVEEPVTIACVSNEVGGDLISNAVWRGVPLRGLLDRAGVQPGATQVVGRSVDDFTVGFPTEKVYDGRTALVAVGMNGEPLPVTHGFPVRLIVAGLYGYVSATKWLKEIELTRLEDYDAYWVPRGWAKQAPIKTQSRVDVPRSGAKVPAGSVAVAGVAWAPTRGVGKVEVKIDDGPWRVAQLGDVANNNTWVQWLYRWEGAPPGKHTVGVRATDGTGQLQTEQASQPDPDGATGYHYRGFTVG